MAAGAWTFYDDFKLRIADGTFDLDAAGTTLTMALFLSTSNFATVTTNVYGSLTNEHANANGYTTGGVLLTSVTWTRSAGTAKLTHAAAQWTASGGSITARAAVIYANATLNSVTKPLVCYCLLDSTPADVTATAGQPFIVTPDATNGVFTLTG